MVHALTRRHGRIAALARGAHRPTSGYFAVLDLFDTLELAWRPRRGGALAELSRGALHTRRHRLARDPSRYRAALAALELAELGSRPGQPEPQLFGLLERALDRLAEGRASPLAARLAFELAFLDLHGLLPALGRCAACGRAAPPPDPRQPRVAFSAGAGGRLCPPCAAEAKAAGRRVGTLPLDTLEAAAAALDAERRGAPPPALEEELAVRTLDWVGRFTGYHLEDRPRSHRAFLAAPDRNARTPAAGRNPRPHPP